MKLAAAVLAVVGILALGIAAIQHFDHVIPSASDHLSLFIAIAGVAALGIGWALSHVGGSEE